MDLEALANRYQGEACLQRLLFIAEQAASAAAPSATTSTDALASQALSLAINLMRKDGNTRKYQTVASSETLGPLLHQLTNTTSSTNEQSNHWLTDAETRNRQELDLLQSRLSAAQSNLHKEAIRTAYEHLAICYINKSMLPEALGAMQRSRDYGTTRLQGVNMLVDLMVPVCIYMQQWSAVSDHVFKLQHASEEVNDGNHSALQYKISIAAGLGALHAKEYVVAASHFRAAAKSGDNASWPMVLAAEEVALYAGILTLAFSERSEMIALSEHVDALLLQPVLRECLILFASRANYTECYKLLESPSIFQTLQLDLYMAEHLRALQSALRQRAILQYWTPLRRVSLSTMVHDLGARMITLGHDSNADPKTTLLELLVPLVRSGKLIDARINLQQQTLERIVVSQKDKLLEETQRKLSNVSNRVLNDSYSLMVRLACMEHHLLVGGAGAGRLTRNKRNNNYGEGAAAGGGGNANEAEVLESDDDSDVMDMSSEEVMMMNPEDLY
ncbi:hypothetical protein MPSEU_000969800 [Mayamaea pseudoterrestris]|nr:hypothetical protein MPSEU_000969800 [Mayamaea pseudoterrestris]